MSGEASRAPLSRIARPTGTLVLDVNLARVEQLRKPEARSHAEFSLCVASKVGRTYLGRVEADEAGTHATHSDRIGIRDADLPTLDWLAVHGSAQRNDNRECKAKG